MILLIGQAEDPHVESVARYLAQTGTDYIQLDTFGPTSDGLGLQLNKSLEIHIYKKQYQLSDVRAVWWRQKPRFIVPRDSVSELYDYYFMHREWNQVLDILSHKLKNCQHVNERQAETRASNKITQLCAAEDQGLLVPRTLISSDPESVRDFLETSAGAVIYKTFTPYMTPSGLVTYTTKIGSKEIVGMEDQIRAAPGIYQDFIPKSHELRITVVGDEIFCARINSKYSEKSEVDWRQEIFSDIYSEDQIQSDASERILRMHKALGLTYGAYDFIVRDDGQLVFMEVNPAGQWYWLELKLGFPISERIGKALMRGLRST